MEAHGTNGLRVLEESLDALMRVHVPQLNKQAITEKQETRGAQ
jgi:hypothetical protein